MIPFMLLCCALICAIAASIRNHGVDGLWLATVLFIIVAALVNTVGHHLTKGTKK